MWYFLTFGKCQGHDIVFQITTTQLVVIYFHIKKGFRTEVITVQGHDPKRSFDYCLWISKRIVLPPKNQNEAVII